LTDRICSSSIWKEAARIHNKTCATPLIVSNAREFSLPILLEINNKILNKRRGALSLSLSQALSHAEELLFQKAAFFLSPLMLGFFFRLQDNDSSM
jgi:hypothetical protein